MSAPRPTRLTPEQRSTRARLAALARWANTEDRSAATRPARDALARKFATAPHPETAMREHMTRMSLAASRKRRSAA